MNGYEELISCLPCAPDLIWDWAALKAGRLGALLEKLALTQQNPEWHGEGDVLIHTMMVCEALTSDSAFRAMDTDSRNCLMLAALLHDAGKITRTRLEDGVLVSPGHGAAGASMVRTLLWQEFGLSGDAKLQAMREAVCLLIRYHTLPLHILDQNDPVLRVRKTAANGGNAPLFTLDMLCMLAEVDVRGRICADAAEKLETIALGRELAREAGCLNGPYSFPDSRTCRAYLSGRGIWPEQPIYNDTWGEVVLMCGLPGAGKDTWISENLPGLPTVCLDDIRSQLGIKPTDNQGPVAQAAKEQAKEYLRAKQPFVWNATCITPMLRDKQIRLFEDYGAAVRIVYLETGWDEGLRRNSQRSRNVPEAAICRMLDNLTPPERWEADRVEWICT